MTRTWPSTLQTELRERRIRTGDIMALEYSSTFIILLQKQPPEATEATVASIAEFAQLVYGARAGGDVVQIVCIASDSQAPYAARLKALMAKYSMELYDREGWTLPFEQDAPVVPEVVDLFDKASKRARGECLVLLDAGTVIKPGSEPVLSSAIRSVGKDMRLVVVSAPDRALGEPLSATFAQLSLQFGLTLTAADGYQVVTRKRLFGGVRYEREEFLSQPESYTLPCLISAIAFEFQRDRSHHGLSVSQTRWV